MTNQDFNEIMKELQESFKKWPAGKLNQLFQRVQFYTADSFRNSVDAMIRTCDNDPSIAKIVNHLIDNGTSTLLSKGQTCPHCGNSGWVNYKAAKEGIWSAVCFCACHQAQTLRSLNKYKTIRDIFPAFPN